MTVVLTVKTQLKRISSHNPTKSSKFHFSKQHLGNDLSPIDRFQSRDYFSIGRHIGAHQM